MAYVAEYQVLQDYILYRVVGVQPFGIMYVRRMPNGSMVGETFRGRVMAEVPDEAAAAVTAYESDVRSE